MSRDGKKKLFLIIVLLLFFVPQVAEADTLMPPVDILTNPMSIGLFIGNFIINFIFFGIAYVFLERKFEKTDKKKFLVTILLITLIGFFADSAVFQYYEYTELIVSSILLGFVIFVADMLICRYYFNLTWKQSALLGIWMGIATNPFMFYIFSFFISYFLLPLGVQPVDVPVPNPYYFLNQTVSLPFANCSGSPDTIIFRLRHTGTIDIETGGLFAFLDYDTIETTPEIDEYYFSAGTFSEEFIYVASDDKPYRLLIVGSPAGQYTKNLTCT